MTVPFDTVFEKGQAGASSPLSFTSNAGTIAGSIGANSNRVLFAGLYVRNTSSVSAVAITWNGVSMTAIGTAVDTPDNVGEIYLFGLIAPATGAQTLSASWTGTSGDAALWGISFYNANQTTAWQNNGSDTGTGTTAASSTTTASGNTTLVFHCNHNATSTTVGTGTSAGTEETLDGNSGMAYKASTTTPETISYTLGSSVGWANIKIDIIAAASSGGSATIAWRKA